VRKGVSEVVRDAAHLHEQLLCLRMERGELQREEVGGWGHQNAGPCDLKAGTCLGDAHG
jgi:hypothetical protein